MDEFPSLGFPSEGAEIIDGFGVQPIYTCRPIPERPEVIAAVWPSSKAERKQGDLAVRLYTPRLQYAGASERVTAESPMHACALIHHLVEQYRTTHGDQHDSTDRS